MPGSFQTLAFKGLGALGLWDESKAKGQARGLRICSWRFEMQKGVGLQVSRRNLSSLCLSVSLSVSLSLSPFLCLSISEPAPDDLALKGLELKVKMLGGGISLGWFPFSFYGKEKPYRLIWHWQCLGIGITKCVQQHLGWVDLLGWLVD